MWHSKVISFLFLLYLPLLIPGYTGLESSYTIPVHSRELQILDLFILINEN